MADVLGARLLSEVKEERLDEFLQSLRSLHDPKPTKRLGLPAIDRLLDVFTHPPPTQQESHPQWGSPPLEQHAVPPRKARPSTIEFCATAPCSGKTQLLYHIASACLTPAAYGEATVGGKEAAVIWIDTDSRFDITRLHSVIRSQLSLHALQSKSLQQDLDQVATAALQHLHVFRPQSSESLIATIRSIPDYLFAPNRHYSSARTLQACIISNISAFLYQDKLDADVYSPQTAEAANAVPQPSSGRFTQRYRDIVSALRALQSKLSCTVVTGNIALSPLQPSTFGSSVRPHLPAAWTAFCTLKVNVVRQRIPKFAPAMSAEEARLEAAERLIAVRESAFNGWVDSWGIEGWESGLREALEALDYKGAFRFRVDQDGVRIEEHRENP
ncbi:hypothetical protein MMC13_000075 [Lambiella insularis]|nr:hypothetical protein [Lambiella insularis]